MFSRRARSAAVVRLFTVPRGVSVWREISLCDRPRKYARTITSRWVGESRQRAEATSKVRESRSEEHTSELQSRQYLVCRLLLEKKKNKPINNEATFITDS